MKYIINYFKATFNYWGPPILRILIGMIVFAFVFFIFVIFVYLIGQSSKKIKENLDKSYQKNVEKQNEKNEKERKDKLLKAAKEGYEIALKNLSENYCSYGFDGNFQYREAWLLGYEKGKERILQKNIKQ